MPAETRKLRWQREVQPARLEAYKQANEDHRHYGKLRWTILTVFLAVAIPLFTVALNKDVLHSNVFWFPFTGGILIAIVFSVSEWRINTALEFLREVVKRLEADLGLPQSSPSNRKREWLRKWLASTLVWTIYVGSIVLWIAASCYRNA